MKTALADRFAKTKAKEDFISQAKEKQPQKEKETPKPPPEAAAQPEENPPDKSRKAAAQAETKPPKKRGRGAPKKYDGERHKLTVEIPKELHDRAKILMALKKETITSVFTKTLEDYVKKHKNALKTLLDDF